MCAGSCGDLLPLSLFRYQFDFAAAVAELGSISLLQWARWNGCYWGHRWFLSAAKGGHVKILIWAREKGCHWDANNSDMRRGSRWGPP